jgi:hypothetical protein
MILAGDDHAAGGQVLYRVVGAVVAEFHLDGPGAARQPEQLVPEADAEYRQVGGQQFRDRPDRVVARLRIARTVRQEHAVRIQRQHVAGGSGRRHHREPASLVGQQPQDVALDAVVIGDHVQPLPARAA